MPVTTSPDISRLAWSYVVEVLKAVDAGTPAAIDPGYATLMAAQLTSVTDLVDMNAALLGLVAKLWLELHCGDGHTAYHHARDLAISMAGT
jgi:hypothetical protein